MGKAKPARWVGIIISVAAHVGVVAGIMVMGMWPIDRIAGEPLEEPSSYLIQGGSRGGSPPPAAAAKKKPAPKAATRPKERTQLAKLENNTSDASGEGNGESTGTGTGDGDGDGPGNGQGDGNGDGIGDILGNTAAIPAKKEPPQLVAQEVFDSRFQSGNRRILPPASVRSKLLRSGTRELLAVIRLCIDSQGRVSSATLVRRTGYPAYDRVIARDMRAWRYKPYRVGGRPFAACAPITFHYQMTQ